MKLKASKRDFKGANVLKVGYCKIQFLYPERDAFAYSSGVYGWACDYYKANDFYVSTGYNPIGKETPETHKVCQRYNQLASQVFSINTNISYDERVKYLSQLQLEFAREIRIVMNWY
jgi:hypothetical protein